MVAFPVVVTARRAGPVTFRAVQGYDDGEGVRWGLDADRRPGDRRGRAAAASRPRRRRRRDRAGRHRGCLLCSCGGCGADPLQER